MVKDIKCTNNARNSSIDFLRVLGLFMVTIVHVNAPYSIDLLAYCGVPLMVFVSGLCVKQSSQQFSWKALFHRLKRLLVPMWIFLTAYWLIFSHFLKPSFYDIVQTYALLGVAPYVWIIRIFIILACITPILCKLVRREVPAVRGGVFVLVALVLQEILCYLYGHCSYFHLPIVKIIMRDYILYIIPYSLFFISAIYIKMADRKTQIICLVAATIVLLFAILYFRLATEDWKNTYWTFLYKYPPRYIYTLYGLFATQLLYVFHKYFEMLGKNKVVTWISKNSLWIYFYHIPCVQFIPFHKIDYEFGAGEFVAKWIVCMAIACALVAVQNSVKRLQIVSKR